MRNILESLNKYFDKKISEGVDTESEETECVHKSLKEEISEEAFDVAGLIIKDIDGKKVVTWDDFNDSYWDATEKVFGKARPNGDDFETDVRSILGYNGYATVFEGENEGGLELVESFDQLKESKDYDFEGFYKEVMETIDEKDRDTYYSDLYLRVTPKSTALLDKYGISDGPFLSTFKDNIEGVRWYEIPFANLGYWNDKFSKKDKVEESSTIDKIDADADDKKERLKAFIAKKVDDIDADRDYHLRKKGLKEEVEEKISEETIRTPRGTFKVYKGTKRDFNEEPDREDWGLWFNHYYPEDAEWKDTLKQYDIYHNHKNDSAIAVKIFDKTVKESADVSDQVTIDTREDGFLEKKRELQGKGYKVLWSGNGKMCLAKPKEITESDKPAATSIEDAQKWVDYDMKKYGRISGKTNHIVRKAGFQIVKDHYGDYEVIAGKYDK